VTTNTTDDNQSGLGQCYKFMSRCIDIAQQEFPEQSPAEIVFSLGLLQWHTTTISRALRADTSKASKAAKLRLQLT
jgi:hypothetical protein